MSMEHFTCILLWLVSAVLKGWDNTWRHQLFSTYFECVYNILIGRFLKVSNSIPHPCLVDEPCLRINIFQRNAKLYGELFSLSRTSVARTRLHNFADIDGMIADMLNRFQYCQGTPQDRTVSKAGT